MSEQGRVRTRRVTLLAVGALVATALTGCQEVLTPDGGLYSASGGPGSLTVSNTQSGDQDREVFFSSQSPSESTSAECETWESGQANAQNGLAFRIQYGDGGWSSVVLERNVFLDGYSSFVVIYFHTVNSEMTYSTGPGVGLGAYLGDSTTQEVFPLQVCASITSSDVLSFAVAKQGDPMPPLGTPGQGATFQLDPSQVPPSGRTGTYVAHVPYGTSTTVDGITIDGQLAPNPMT